MKVSPMTRIDTPMKASHIDGPASPIILGLRHDRNYLRRSCISQNSQRRSQSHFFSASLFRQEPKDYTSVISKDDDSSIAYTGSIAESDDAAGSTTVSKHNKLDAQVYFRSPYTVAGATVDGFIDLKCMVDGQVRIGRICVELVGYEEVNDRAKVNTEEATYNHEFLHQVQKLQDPSDPYPICDLMNRANTDNEFWLMEKGRVALPFSITLPADVGSSFTDKAGSVKYVVAANVEFITNARVRTLCIQKQLKVHQNLNPLPEDLESLQKTTIVERASGKVFMGGNGLLSCEARIAKAVWTAGTPISVTVRVRNATSKKVSNVKLALIRRIKTFCLDKGPSLSSYKNDESGVNNLSPVSLIRQVIAEASMSKESWWNGIIRDSESEFMTDITIPSDEHTLRNRTIVQISHVLQVTLSTSLTSEVSLELPLVILHPVSLEPPPQLFMQSSLAARAPIGLSALTRLAASMTCDTSVQTGKEDTAELSASASSTATSPMVASPRSVENVDGKAKGPATIVVDGNGEPHFTDLSWAANAVNNAGNATAAR
ncbi:hypothetical protein K450DRAFT_303784 [Umbelopsis ramanniana AG]|uniref:Arrestin C-terminal-like domain-containing protein n=1 Tax=Umbelopsis ramanniana AG TaxID=1314678 RepID=A0AAD5DYY4_UMBRA|nr:uncharacterized protein K450DRAFT_303784 [Umbelopsis ramanniana AG]KAI8575128.1 hypothetical protein K450DRAFT_303784 [Umbelopsis ramanniana AG]